LERNGFQLERALGRLQSEMDLTLNRVDRLSLEDNYGAPDSARPVPAAKDEKDPSRLKPLYDNS
jgi:hypothetical protein